jgi:S-(hydroxymethyl)glutathione dehydrogenase/alcohol dehydrogenase
VPADAKITANTMIARTLALDDINKGFDIMHAGRSIRSVVVHWGDCK